MRIPPLPPEPAGLVAVKERITGLRQRFAGRGGSFEAAAASAAGPPAGGVEEAIARAAAQHGLEPGVLRALAQVESGLRPDAVSPDGAMGMLQLMPGTARRLGVADPLDLEANLEGGARYLKEQLDRFGGDLALALAAYNAGPGAVVRYGGVPPYPETRGFVSRVLDLLGRNADLVRPRALP